MDIFVTLIVGAAGGVVVLACEHLILHFKEKRTYKSQQLVRFPHDERVIDESIFSHLRHGASIELMKSTLGTPNKVSKTDHPVFLTSRWDAESDPNGDKPPDGYDEVPGVTTHSYLYTFKNADVKITSKDNETIDSLTVVCNDGSIRLANLVFPWADDAEDLRLGQAIVTKEMIQDCRADFIQTRWDNKFVLSLYVGSPTYDFVTYFGYVDADRSADADKSNAETFVGGTIDGVCLSQDDTDVYYIYFSELR